MPVPCYQADFFAELHQGGRLQDRLTKAWQMFNQQCPGIDRLSVALFQEAPGRVKTYLAAPAEENPLRNYQVPLEQVESLVAVAVPGRVRIINDLGTYSAGKSEHSRKIFELGMRSSFTLPIFEQAQLRGFVFFDSRQREYFQPANIPQVNLFGHLLAQLVLSHQATLRSLIAALRISIGMLHHKDPETGNHLERMARIAQLIAEELVRRGQAELDDEELDDIFRFAPLHDIGKVGIPDRILLKPGRLDEQEWSVMKTHSDIGRSIIDQLINEFGFSGLPNIEILRQIAELHHEKLDGSGYPHGLAGEQVPLVARIVGVSDIFDALTSERPYKPAWTNQEALRELEQLSLQNRADSHCVAALKNRLDEILAIQRQFADH
jgi:HD-GYP domain-containing protein (c-di-GMP phosphodiesterase class II)